MVWYNSKHPRRNGTSENVIPQAAKIPPLLHAPFLSSSLPVLAHPSVSQIKLPVKQLYGPILKNNK